MPFTIKYSVKPDGEKYKFVATVVDKSGNKEFESFEEPLASPNAPRDAAYQKVTQKESPMSRGSRALVPQKTSRWWLRFANRLVQAAQLSRP